MSDMNVSPQNLAEWNRLATLEAEKAKAAPPETTRNLPPEDQQTAKNDPATIDRDTFKREGEAYGAHSEDARAALYDRYDTQKDGLSAAEFDQMLKDQDATARKPEDKPITAAQLADKEKAATAAIADDPALKAVLARTPKATDSPEAKKKFDDDLAQALAGKPAVTDYFNALTQATKHGPDGKGDVTMANQSRDRFYEEAGAKLGLRGDAKDAFETTFSRQRANHTHATSEGQPPMGVNNGKNPKYYGHVWEANGNTKPSTAGDLMNAGTGVDNNFAARLDESMKNGYNDVRLEMDPTRLPDPAIATAYEFMKQDDPAGTAAMTTDQIAAKIKSDPGFQAKYKSHLDANYPGDKSRELDQDSLDSLNEKADPAAAPHDQTDLAKRLMYQETMNQQLAEIAKRTPPLSANLVMQDIGDFNAKLKTGENKEFQAPAPGSEAQKYVDDMVARTKVLAEAAQKNKVASIEIGNEVNLRGSNDKDQYYKTDEPNNPETQHNAARRYAYLAGSIYNALKESPKTDKVNANVSLNYMETPGAPFQDMSDAWAQLEKDPGKLEEWVPSTGDPAVDTRRRQDFRDMLAQGRDAEDARDKAAKNGETDAVKNDPAARAKNDETYKHNKHIAEGTLESLVKIHEQARKVADPTYSSLNERGNPKQGPIAFLEEMARAQQQFFPTESAKREREGKSAAMTDQTNLHLYGTAQGREETIAALARLRANNIVPEDTIVGEYGSRSPDQARQAREYADTSSEMLAQFERHKAKGDQKGLKLVRTEGFTYHDHEGWGVNDNRYLADNAARR